MKHRDQPPNTQWLRVLFCHWVDQNYTLSCAPAKKAHGKTHRAQGAGGFHWLVSTSNQVLNRLPYRLELPCFPLSMLFSSQLTYSQLLHVWSVISGAAWNITLPSLVIEDHMGPISEASYPWMFLWTFRGFKTSLRFPLALICWQHISFHLHYLRKGRLCLYMKEKFCLFLHITYFSFPRRKKKGLQPKSKYTHTHTHKSPKLHA